eukprot:scaffold7063_cov351-Pinguiococcus_pyrenoidosus.AAC.3
MAYTLRCRQSQVLVHVPSDAPPTFHTPLVRTDWTLRFAFSIFVPRNEEARKAWEDTYTVVPKSAVPAAFRVGPYADEALADMKIEVLEWQTPLRVLGSRNKSGRRNSLNPSANGHPPAVQGSASSPVARSELDALASHTGIPAGVLESVDRTHRERRLQNNPTLEDDLHQLRQAAVDGRPQQMLGADSDDAAAAAVSEGLGFGVTAQRQILARLEVQRTYAL